MGCAFGVTTRASCGLIDTGRILSGVFHLAITKKLKPFCGIVRTTRTRRVRDLLRLGNRVKNGY
jgi:hypothetical protein